MLICALDPGPRGLRIVLVGAGSAPVLIERRRYKLEAAATLVEPLLQEWQADYGAISLLVCRAGDALPCALVTVLQDSTIPLHWLERDAVEEACIAFRLVQTPSRYVRAVLMACCVRTSGTRWLVRSGHASAYRLVRSQAMDARINLWLAGWPAVPDAESASELVADAAADGEEAAF